MIEAIRNAERAIEEHGNRLEARRIDAARAVMEGNWLVAFRAIGDCIGHEESMGELRHQIELAEIDIDNMLCDMKGE